MASRRCIKRTMEYDVIIVGSGIAGHIFAYEFAKTGRRMVMLEAGSVRPSAASQCFYRGYIAADSLPHPRPELWRVRALGGTSNTWGGALVPYDKGDFAVQDVSGRILWPIRYEELQPFYDRVLPYFGIHGVESIRVAYMPNRHSFFTDTAPLPSFESRPFIRKKGTAPAFPLPTMHVPNLDVRTNHQVVDFDVARERIQTVIAFDGQAKVLRRFSARAVVLAAGGLETTRIVMSSALMRNIPNRDCVGRFYSPHINQPLGLAFRTAGAPVAQLDYKAYNASSEYRTFLSPVESLVRTGGINTKFLFERAIRETWRSFYVLARLWGKRRIAAAFDNTIIQVYTASDQTPCADSTVRLSSTRGTDGLPKIIINHQCNSSDFARIDYVARVLTHELAAIGWRYYPKRVCENTVNFSPASHHIGTLRMADASPYGIVDPQLRLYGVSNCFVCSSAVFPTAGHANPTFTIAAFAARLAAYLARE